MQAIYALHRKYIRWSNERSLCVCVRFIACSNIEWLSAETLIAYRIQRQDLIQQTEYRFIERIV